MTTHRNFGRASWILAGAFTLFLGVAVAAEDKDREVCAPPCQKMNLGPLPADQKFSAGQPRADWAQGVKPGEAIVRNRVLYRVISATNQDQPKPTDAQRKQLGYPPIELMQPIPSTAKDVWSKRATQRASLVDWVVEKEYAFLPDDKKSALRTQLRAVGQASLDLDRSLHATGKAPAPTRKQLQQMNDLLARLIILDRDAYKTASPEAQKARFGRPLTAKDYARTQTEVAARTAKFITGDYMIADKMRQQMSTASLLRQETRVERQQIGGPDWISLEGRVYVAEHPVFDFWQAGIEHSSVLAGRWGYAAQSYYEYTYRIAPAPPGPETDEARNARLQGTLISKTKVTEEGWKFIDWVWANGAAGSYQSDDKLELVEVVRYASDTPYLWQDSGALDIALGSFLPWDEGRYCRNWGTSYATGLYAFDFVCHQTANAFMYHRRNTVPVSHWYSFILYGVTGNQEISDCSTWWNSAMHGCIPGNWCVGNHFPYTASAIAEGMDVGSIVGPAGAVIGGAGAVAWEFIFEAAPGDGYGLESLWRQGDRRWIWSEASFNSTSVTPVGQDDTPTMRTVEILPLN